VRGDRTGFRECIFVNAVLPEDYLLCLSMVLISIVGYVLLLTYI